MPRTIIFEGRSMSFPDDATDDEIAEVLSGQQAAPTAQQQPNAAYDAAASIPGGIASGVAGMAGLPAEIGNALRYGVNSAMDYATGKKEPTEYRRSPLSSGNLYNAMGAPFGGFYEPKTTAGEYARTIASFAPGAMSPGGPMMRAARVVVPGVASETAGQVFKGDPYLETPARIVGGLAGGAVTEAAPAVADFIKRGANKLVSMAGRKEFLDPTRAAHEYIAPAFRGQKPSDISDRIAAWNETGADAPAWVDVAGGEFRRRARSAATTPLGGVPDIVTKYQRETAGALQGRAHRISDALTPGMRQSGAQYADDLEELRGTLATEKYAAPYEAKVPLSKSLATGLFDKEGSEAVGQAIKDARVNLDYKTVGELNELQSNVSILRSGKTLRDEAGRLVKPEAAQEISGRALDRVRIAMREAGNRAARDGNNYRASGYFTRVGLIDKTLDNAPGLIPARQEYLSMSKQMEAVPIGAGGVQRNITEAVAPMEGMQKTAAGVGYRSALGDAIEHPAAGSTGLLNRIATAPEQTKNLSALFGPKVAARTQRGLLNEIERLQDARYINADMGSKTMPAALDAYVFDKMPTSKRGAMAFLFDILRGSSTLTPSQSAEVVKIATSPAVAESLLGLYPQLPRGNAGRNLLLDAILGSAPPPKKEQRKRK